MQSAHAIATKRDDVVDVVLDASLARPPARLDVDRRKRAAINPRQALALSLP